MKEDNQNYFYRKKTRTRAKISEEIEKIQQGEELPDEIVILPPSDNSNDTYIDFRDEDYNDPDRLNRRQLQTLTI